MRLLIRWTAGIAPAALVAMLSLVPSAGWAQAKPDLIVTSITAPPASALPGDSFVVTAAVQNQGAAAADISVTKFFLKGVINNVLVIKNLKGVQNVGPLAANGGSESSTVTVSVFSDTKAGTYNLVACADGNGTVREVDDVINNCLPATGTITIEDVPDLVVTTISEPPSTATQGGTFGVTSTVKNTSATKGAGASRLKYYLVSDLDGTRIDMKADTGELDVPALNALGQFLHAANLAVRAETIPGSYHLQACADAGKAVPETDENDNCKTSNGSVQVTGQPDLIVKNVVVAGAPLSVPQGGTVNITAIVKNIGSLNAAASTMKFRLIPPPGTPQKNLKGTVPVPPLAPTEKTTIQATAEVDQETAPTTYTVQACVDTAKVVTESSEGNNCEPALNQALTVTGLPLSLADLSASLLGAPPASKQPGESFQVSVTIRNHGTGDSIETTTRFSLISVATGTRKNLKGGQIIAPLQPNTTAPPAAATVQVFSDTAPGTYFLEACADGDDVLNEIDEDDNCVVTTGKITITEVPNLKVSNLSDPPASVQQGKSFNVTDTVKNTSLTMDVKVASTVKFFLVSTTDSTRIDLKGTQGVPALLAGQKFITDPANPEVVTVQTTTLPGTYHLQACADSGKDVAETDEDDNCLTSAGVVQVVALPDLIVNRVTLPPAPATVTLGGTLNVTAVAKNQGLGNAGGSVMRFFLVVTPGAGPVKKLAEIVQVPPIAAGAKQVMNVGLVIPADVRLGAYYLQSCVDQNQLIAETSETNNCGTSDTTFEVK